uniref:Ovule protein n=1 Tax=Hydatigena taeniaeformis TaxID=6205 RepID=A0A0R3WZY8_HYDTA
MHLSSHMSLKISHVYACTKLRIQSSITHTSCLLLIINHIIPVFCVHTHLCSSHTPNQKSCLTTFSVPLFQFSVTFI